MSEAPKAPEPSVCSAAEAGFEAGNLPADWEGAIRGSCEGLQKEWQRALSRAEDTKGVLASVQGWLSGNEGTDQLAYTGEKWAMNALKTALNDQSYDSMKKLNDALTAMGVKIGPEVAQARPTNTSRWELWAQAVAYNVPWAQGAQSLWNRTERELSRLGI